jgi:NADH-quinone oxidoreductase subunit A
MYGYIPILILLVIASAVAFGLIIISRLLGPQRRLSEKDDPYECGMPPIDDPKQQYSIKYFLVAALFIIFDVEILFLVPWAVVFKEFKLMELGSYVIIEALVFMFILILGFLYAIKKEAFIWEK